MSSPRDYGLHHDEWRPQQFETLEWIQESSKTVVLEASTGSGKTALARAITQKKKGIALARTKALQQENYEGEYGFDVLYGKGNYACVHPEAHYNAMADECLFAETSMYRCPHAGNCGYLQSKIAAINSKRASLNYSYWLHVYDKWEPPEILICDEAHQLSDIVLEWAGCKITASQRLEWQLPPFPAINSEVGSRSMLSRSESKNPEDLALDWLAASIKVLALHRTRLEASSVYDKGARKDLRKCDLLNRKVTATFEAMQSVRDCWFIVSGPQPGRRSIADWEFFAKPLTARFHFPRYFINEYKLMLMSATIGNIDAFAKELGLINYDFRTVPSVWEPSVRPVYQLDIPRMGRKSTEKDWLRQAEEIAKAIKAVDRRWGGLIHVNSMNEADNLAGRLARLGLQDRIYVQPRVATNLAVEQWQERKRRYRNSLMITWALWEGYNGLDERINIVAKVPYANLGEPFEQARMRFSGEFFTQRAATKLEQGIGRTRRGRKEDYDIGGIRSGLVCVADGGINYVKNYLSQSMRESLIKGRPE